jgi:hypothetical protein
MILNSIKRWRIIFKDHMTGDHRPLLWPCIAESDEELRADEWLMDLEASRARAHRNGRSNLTSSLIAKKAAVQGTWATPTSTLDAAFVVILKS